LEHVFWAHYYLELYRPGPELANLALMKLAHYHRAHGDKVHFSKHVERQRGEPTYDRVYGSAIFSFSAQRVQQFKRQFPDAIVGGTHDVSDRRTVEDVLGIDENARSITRSIQASTPRSDSPSAAAGSSARFAWCRRKRAGRDR